MKILDKDENCIKIRRATVKDNLMIENFYTEAFPDVSSLKFPSRWNWLYFKNPFCKDNENLPVWIAIHKDRVVGMAGTMQSPFHIGEYIFTAAWGCDFRVLSDLRGKGLGKTLEKARMTNNFFSLQMSKLSRVVKTKAGGVPGKTTTSFLHVKRFEPFLLFEDLLRYLNIKSARTSLLYQVGIKLHAHKLFSLFITSLFNFYPKMRAAPSNQSNLSNIEFKAVDYFDETATNLWDIIGKKYSLAVRRDSSYLNWKFVKQPHIIYQRFIVLDNGKPCGILIFRLGQEPEIPVGTIAEAYTNRSNSVLKEMISFAIRSLYNQGALMVRCASTMKELSDILSYYGFRPYQHFVPLFLLEDNKAYLQKQALNGEWFMSLGDQDLDEYPHAGQPSLNQIVKIIFGKIIGHEDIPNRDFFKL